MPNLVYFLIGMIMIGISGGCLSEDEAGQRDRKTPYQIADGIKGGITYDQWYASEAGGKGDLYAPDNETNTTSATNTTKFSRQATTDTHVNESVDTKVETAATTSDTHYNLTVGSEFVRCVSCHGWDGLGTSGVFADRSGLSTGALSQPDVSSLNLRERVGSLTNKELFIAIQNKGGRNINLARNHMPDYSEVLTDQQIWNLVKFMKEEWLPTNWLYQLEVQGDPIAVNESGVVIKPTLAYSEMGDTGSPEMGGLLISQFCVTCHGIDGKSIETKGYSGIGAYTRSRPAEAWFKIKFGVIGSEMVPLSIDANDPVNFRHFYSALSNINRYPD